jgi:hypothetical protein
MTPFRGNRVLGTAPARVEPSSSNKEWALRRLEGVTKSCVQSVKRVAAQQVVAAEQLEWGGTKEETYAMIHKGMVEVPNADPTKVAALTKRFPKLRNARWRIAVFLKTLIDGFSRMEGIFALAVFVDR